MARRSSQGWRMRLFGAVLLAALIGAAWGWWALRNWQPPRSVWPVQGVEIGAGDGPQEWTALKAIGADFVYLDATASVFAHDPGFIDKLEAARDAGLKVGVVHRYDPCQPAERQSANFVTQVPRDSQLLPPAVELDQLADDCPMKVSEATVLSELTTFINQIEIHTGKPVLLKVSRAFERRYHAAGALDRRLWLVQTRIAPEYAGRPWTLWTANGGLATEATPAPVRWVVMQK